MNIQIWGDSWGVPNRTETKYNNFTAEKHTEFRLRALGHSVLNLSVNGGYNLQSMTQSSKYPRSNVIIWFHTCLCRDFVKFDYKGAGKFDPDKVIEETADKVYSYAAQCADAQLIVIEGHNEVHRPAFERHLPNAVVIPTIIKTLTKKTYPYSQWFTMSSIHRGVDILNESTWTLPTVTNEIDKWNKRLDIVRDCQQYFPDRCHPGDYGHEIIVDSVLKSIR